MRLSLMACLVSLVATAAPALASSLPPGVKSVLFNIHRAAKAKDFAALRANMDHAFIWSFGDEANADHAIADWTKRPKQLRKLARLTQGPCAKQDDGSVECPINAGAAVRAGFKKIDGRWKMTYFVEGD